MEIPIKKKRLFRILEDLDRRHDGNVYTDVYNDDMAIQVLSRMGFVEIKSGSIILSHINEFKGDGRAYEHPAVHLKNDFLTQVGLALFREHDENFD